MSRGAEGRRDLEQAQLEIYLLGPPKVMYAGRALAIPRRQTRALLYRLAARLEPVPREQLCFLFWPDIPESNARRFLTHLLTHLRRVLPFSEALRDTGDQIGLDPERVWSDTATFEKLCGSLGRADATASSPGGRVAEVVRRGQGLEQAVALYRGPFLSGFSLPKSPEFETWAAEEQRVYERVYLRALAVLLEERVAQGEQHVAIAYAQRYLETDELAEDVHRRLIELYAATGDRCAALRQFEHCATVLERELGVSPLPETRAVYRAILEDRPMPQVATRPAWTTLPGLHTPLVGRDEAERQLQQAYGRAHAGHGGVVLISGEAGIGKSRLMQDFATPLQERGLVLVGAGCPETQMMPYLPIVQALRTALDAGKGKSPVPLVPFLRSLPQVWLVEASRLLPELRAIYPDLPPPLPAEPEEARNRLFEALSRLILGLAVSPLLLRTAAPLLLCLDDLHAADKATLAWLAYLGPRLRSSPLLVLGTYRSEEAETVAELRHSLARSSVLTELKLSGLDEAGVLQLLRHLMGSLPGAEAFACRLQRLTGGNPFFVLEMLRALMETDQLAGALAGVELWLPDTVREAVGARVDRLSAVARQVLEAGAVVGTGFDLDVVRLVAGRRELEVVDALDELVARRLLVEEPSGYRFQHDVVRWTVAASLSPVRQQLLHRRAARVLERLDPNAVAVLAYHFEYGGELGKALDYHDRAARHAAALYAWREAEEHQTRMLELLERMDPQQVDPGHLARRAEVLAERAHQRYLQGRLADRDTDLAALVTLADSSGDPKLRLWAALHRARYLNLGGQYEQAILAAERDLACFVPDPALVPLEVRPTLCHLLIELGSAYYFLGQPREGLRVLGSALAMAGERPAPNLRGPICHYLAYLYLHLGEYHQALAYQQQAYACHQAAGDENGMAWAELDLGFLHLKLGHFPEAERHLSESQALAQRIGARPAQAYARTYTGYLELYRGRYASAAERLRHTLTLHEAVHQVHGMVAAEVGRGLALYHLGAYAEARCALQRAVEQARSVSHRRRWIEALVGLGLVELAEDHPLGARRCLEEAIGLARVTECREGLVTALAALARAERQAGDCEAAALRACEAVRVAQEADLPCAEMWGEVEVGLALLEQGDPVAALGHTARAVALMPQAHEGWVGTEEACCAHACVLQALGRADEARAQIVRARAIVAAKARLIPDARERSRYIRATKRGRWCALDRNERTRCGKRLEE